MASGSDIRWNQRVVFCREILDFARIISMDVRISGLFGGWISGWAELVDITRRRFALPDSAGASWDGMSQPLREGRARLGDEELSHEQIFT
jgi:hypothetical protein